MNTEKKSTRQPAHGTENEEAPFAFEQAVLKYPEETKGLASVIIPMYNTKQQYLKEALDSILAQTYENWEAVLVDSGSTQDDVRQICAEYAKNDSRFKYIRVEENAGTLLARKTGLENAKGEFIATLDHDDTWQPQFLEKMVEEIQNGYDFVACLWSHTGDAETAAHAGGPNTLGEDAMKNIRELGKSHLWNKLVKRSIYAKVIYPQAFIINGEDWVQNFQVIYHSKKTGYVPQVLHNYRVDSDTSATFTRNSVSENRRHVSSIVSGISIYIIAKQLLGPRNAEELFAAAFGNSFVRYFIINKRQRRYHKIEYAKRFVPAYSRGLKGIKRKNLRWLVCFLASKGLTLPLRIYFKVPLKFKSADWFVKLYHKFAFR